MALVQWKQISNHLSGSGQLTGSLELSGSLFVNGQEITSTEVAGIFSETGSYYSTTNDLKVTGSLNILLDDNNKEFTVSSTTQDEFTVNNEGVVILGVKSGPVTAVEGGIFYSSSNEFYLGFSN